MKLATLGVNNANGSLTVLLHWLAEAQSDAVRDRSALRQAADRLKRGNG